MRFRSILLAGLVWSGPAMAADLLPATQYDPAHRGGTLRLAADGPGGTIDPAINYQSEFAQLFTVTGDGLTTFRKARGRASDEAIADLAEALPEPLDGGLTYVFHLRRGIRFSDGREVRVADVVASMRRLFVVHSPTSGSFFGSIVGADACLRDSAHCTLPGVIGDEAAGTITFHLTHPDADFFDKLAFPHASILPADTPLHDLGNDAPPTTGPYRFVSYNPNSQLVMERNPFFHVWNAEAQPDGYADRIVYTFGVPDEAQVTAVENGQYDWGFDNIPLDRLGELGDRFTAQTHIEGLYAIYYITMNTRLAPFDNVLVRRAINYAVNRHAISILYGGTAISQPLCDMTPPGIAGHVGTCPYTKGADLDHPAPAWAAPDMERAKQLVEQSGTRGQHITLIISNRAAEQAMGAYLQSMLTELGYKTSLKAITNDIQFNYIQNTNNRVQIALTDWYADYAKPSDFIYDLFSCTSFHPGSDASINITGLCDPGIEALMDRAGVVSVTDRARGAQLWADAGRAIQALAPTAPLIQIDRVNVVSKRLGNFFTTDLYHLLFSQVWVR
jgi:peptide/nickel transport system substrate-binding protein